MPRCWLCHLGGWFGRGGRRGDGQGFGGGLQPLLEGLLRDKGLSLDDFARPAALPLR